MDGSDEIGPVSFKRTVRFKQWFGPKPVSTPRANGRPSEDLRGYCGGLNPTRSGMVHPVVAARKAWAERGGLGPQNRFEPKPSTCLFGRLG